MRTFLLWRARHAGPRPEAVAAALAERFAPVLAEPPATHARSSHGVHLAWIELPVEGFRAPFLEEDGERWAFAAEYPLNARRLLRERGTWKTGEPVLPALGHALERDHAAIVRELVPPASLVWAAADGVHVANDGLGQAQLFEYEDEHLWVLTNRVTALPVLGVALRPVRAEWAARMVTNWFPLDRSGYAGVRYLAGGTHLVVGPSGVKRTRHDPIGDWVHPPARTRAESLELGRQALMRTLEDAVELCERPTLGLSGGWDSRAVASCLRVLGADFSARVRGQENHFDVIVSAELARVAGFPHRVKSEGGIPPGTAEGCRASVTKALLWQGGYFATKKHKNFLAKEGATGLDGGVVNVMGQHAGLGKADFVVKTDALNHPRATDEQRLLDLHFTEGPGLLRPAAADEARELLRASYRAAHAYDLSGLGPLLFFYLHEFTRRWGSATVNSQTGLVVAPFLCPDMIRACYGLDGAELVHKPIHRHTTATNAPDWTAIPYADQVTEADFHAGRLPRVAPPNGAAADDADLPRWRQVRHHRKYHYKYFWKDVGQPLLKEAFAQGGFWTELFDADRVREEWLSSKGVADAVVVAYLVAGS